jgi:hypothetical protein
VSGTAIHGTFPLFLSACAFFFLLGNYYLYGMNVELRKRLPESKWNSRSAWLVPLPLHREHCPGSPTRRKCLACAVAMVLCGYAAFLARIK